MHLTRTSFSLALAALLAGCAFSPTGSGDRFAERAGPIKNVVVIYAENHSFDNMYGLFPGANGIANATPEQYTQLGHDGKPLPELGVLLRRRVGDAVGAGEQAIHVVEAVVLRVDDHHVLDRAGAFSEAVAGAGGRDSAAGKQRGDGK
jgi:phospholipase C